MPTLSSSSQPLNMLGYIEKLKRQPEHQRRKAALFIALGATVLIAAAWGVSLGLRLGGGDFSFRDGSTDKAAPTSIRETFANIAEEWKNLTSSPDSASSSAAATLR